MPIKLIAGTSMGAIIGGLYSQRLDSFEVEQRIKEFLQSPLFQKARETHPTQPGAGSWIEHLSLQLMHQVQHPEQTRDQIARTDVEMQEALKILLQDQDIRNSQVPFVAVASDLLTGAEVVLTQGSMLQAVLASSAMPGVLSPVKVNGHLLSDGAATSAVPIRAARRIASKSPVVAVDVSTQLSGTPVLNHPLDVILRNSAITGRCYHQELIKEADVLVQPHVKVFSWSDFDHVEDFIAEGEQAALKQIRAIKNLARMI